MASLQPEDAEASPVDVLWARRSLPDLLAEQDLIGVEERPFPNDGWSGSVLTVLEDRGRRYVLKRTSAARDWIVRSTRDSLIREAVLAAGPDPFRAPLRTAHLGAASDKIDASDDPAAVAGPVAVILMPDLSGALLHWNQGAGDGSGAAINDETLDRVLAAIAELHAQPWSQRLPTDWPWCPDLERVTLLTRPSAERYAAEGVWVGGRFLEGWDAFARAAPPAARDLVADLSRDVQPLLDALTGLPRTGLHGDLKLANVALHPTGEASFIDWQMTGVGPIALELGWFLAANVADLRDGPDRVLDRYRTALGTAGGDEVIGDWEAQRDLALIVGLLLRGWRKGLDAEGGLTLPTGVPARDDLAWWSAAAIEAAARRL
ncbi:MAG: phosphotransferase [Chloroflexota bacterium]